MKSALIFCAVFAFLCSFQADAGVLTNFLDGPVAKAKNALDNLIINTSEKLQSAMDKAQENVDEFVVNAQEWAENTKDKVHDNLKGILDKVDEEINKLKKMSEEQGIDLGHCEKIAHKVQRNAIELTDGATGCVTDRVHQVTKNIEPLKEKVNDMKNTLTDFLKSFAECVSDPETSSVRNMACLTENNVRATYEIGKRVPSLLLESAKFTGSVWLSPLPTGYCITKNSFLTSIEQSKKMVDHVQQCVSEQVKKMRGEEKVADA